MVLHWCFSEFALVEIFVADGNQRYSIICPLAGSVLRGTAPSTKFAQDSNFYELSESFEKILAKLSLFLNLEYRFGDFGTIVLKI